MKESAYKKVHGNLLDLPGDIRVIAHGCNTKNIMRKGLAKSIATRYPEMLAADTAAAKAGTNKLGRVSWAQIGEDPKTFGFNLYQQQQFYQFNLLGYKQALKRMFDTLKAMGHGDLTVGLPWKIGCGLAKGDWNEVLVNTLTIAGFYDNPLVFVDIEPEPTNEEENNQKENHEKESEGESTQAAED